MGLIKPEVYDSLYREEQFLKYKCLLELGVKFEGTVLDAGCGTALLYEYLVLNYGRLKARYVCLDPDPGMLKIASAKLNSPLAITVEAYAEELPVRQGAIDLVVSVSTWGVLEKAPQALVELRKSIREGGLLVLTGHPRTYTRKPEDMDSSLRYVKSCIDDFYVATP